MFILEVNRAVATMFGGVIPALFMKKKEANLERSVFRAAQDAVTKTFKKTEQFISAQSTGATRNIMDIQK